MDCRNLFSKIEELNEKYIKIWQDVCNIESPTNFKEGVDKVGRYFIDLADKKGWKTEVFEQKIAGDVVCITLNPESDEAPICFSGHTDTVHPVGLFGDTPVRLDQTKIYGPGVCDCKGGVVASFMAMDALDACGFVKRPVMLLLQSDEEVGSSISNNETIKYICEKSKNAIAFFNTEDMHSGSVVLTRKGILRCKFIIDGIAAHSARCMNGASAILEASHKIIELEKFKDPNGITCNCGIISGGNTPNTVAQRCEFVADIRFGDDAQLKKAREAVETIADKNFVDGCKCEVVEISYRPAMPFAQKNLDLLNQMNKIYSQIGLDVLEWKSGMGGSDAAYTTLYGIPCVDSIGVNGGYIHSTNEYAYLSSLTLSAKYLASFAFCV